MLINGNNGLSGGRLPSSLLETYVRYKKDTKVIVAWLVSHGTRRYKSLSVVSIRDLMRLASIVQEKAVVMPATIDFHFREAIAARKPPFAAHFGSVKSSILVRATASPSICHD